MKNLFLILAIIAVGFQAQANKFELNEVSVESAFEQSTDLTSKINMMTREAMYAELGFPQAIEEGSKQTVAAIVGIVSLFTGIGVFIPIHRFILGTDGKGLVLFAVYCGLGLVSGLGSLLTLADCVFLLIDDTKSAYINNGKIFMWADNL
jgi:hypothetical protein